MAEQWRICGGALSARHAMAFAERCNGAIWNRTEPTGAGPSLTGRRLQTSQEGVSSARHYTPSPLEAAWLTTPVGSANGGTDWCPLAKRQASSQETQRSLRFARRSGGASPHPLTKEERSVVSSFKRSGCVEPIEPLVGTARHPMATGTICRADRGRSRFLLNFSHLILANQCGEPSGARGCLPIGGRPPAATGRNLFYDLGCAQYTQQHFFRQQVLAKAARFNLTQAEAERRIQHRVDSHLISLGGGAMGASIPLFRALYRQNCISFDHIWGWEAKPLPNWWDRVPEPERSKITFFNEPVSASDASALGVLKRTARKEDFVVLKLDIDTPKVERQIVERIRSEPALFSLIDEFLFEYHLNDSAAPDGAGADGAQAVRVMSELRQKGVRSHFWV